MRQDYKSKNAVSRRKMIYLLGWCGSSFGVTLAGGAALSSCSNSGADRVNQLTPKASLDKPQDERHLEPSTSPIPPSDFLRVDIIAAKPDEAGTSHTLEDVQVYVFTEPLEGVGIELAPLLGDTFLMGTPEGQGYEYEHPQHEVSVPSLLMSCYEVTQAQWKTVASLPLEERELIAEPSNFEGLNRPVENVNWDDAREFCLRLSRYSSRNYRLPTEAEWEYACRAGTTSIYSFGNTMSRNSDRSPILIVSNGSTEGAGTDEVGLMPANSFGLYNMHGNVKEWCQDHRGNYNETPVDGSAFLKSEGDSMRVVRGGSWDGYPDHSRSSYRSFVPIDRRAGNLGFRVVCTDAFVLPS